MGAALAIVAVMFLALRRPTSAQQQDEKPKLPTDVADDQQTKDIKGGIDTGVGFLKEGIAIAGALGISASVFLGWAVVIADIVILIVVGIDRGVRDAQWVSDSIRKGQEGLRTDLVNYACQFARGAVDKNKKLPLTVAAMMGVGVIRGYNDCMRAGVDKIPWGTPDLTVHRAYWAERAMYLVDDSALEQLVFDQLKVTPVEKQQVPLSARERVKEYGVQYGKLLACWMAASKKMLEPWHYDWLAKVRGDWFGQWTIGDWDGPFGAQIFINAEVPGLSWDVPTGGMGAPDMRDAPQGFVPKTYCGMYQLDWAVAGPSAAQLAASLKQRPGVVDQPVPTGPESTNSVMPVTPISVTPGVPSGLSSLGKQIQDSLFPPKPEPVSSTAPVELATGGPSTELLANKPKPKDVMPAAVPPKTRLAVPRS